MALPEIAVFSLLALAVGFFLYTRIRSARQKRHIERTALPVSVKQKLSETYPHLKPEQAQKVLDGLREYFYLCHTAGQRMVSMPSQAVDVAWHEFILNTRRYHQYCQRAFGRYLHHTPAQAMSSPTLAQEGIKRAWWLACKREGIDSKHPERLPLLFAMDKELNITDGFFYALDCKRVATADYCASHIGCGSGCGGDSDSGGSDCGGGCGGD